MRCLWCKKTFIPINGFGHGKNFCNACSVIIDKQNRRLTYHKYKEKNREYALKNKYKGMHTSSLLKLKTRHEVWLAAINVEISRRVKQRNTPVKQGEVQEYGERDWEV